LLAPFLPILLLKVPELFNEGLFGFVQERRLILGLGGCRILARHAA
jgi:hypothetical protein